MIVDPRAGKRLLEARKADPLIKSHLTATSGVHLTMSTNALALVERIQTLSLRILLVPAQTHPRASRRVILRAQLALRTAHAQGNVPSESRAAGTGVLSPGHVNLD